MSAVARRKNPDSSWLDRLTGWLFGRKNASPAPTVTPTRSSPARDRAVAVRRAPAASPAPDEAAGFAAYADFIGLVLNPPPARTSALPEVAFDPESLDRVCTAVLAHFQTHRPGPNSFPSLSMRIMNLLGDPDAVDLAELGRLIALDPALSANVLRVANSAALSSINKVESVRDAIVKLGLREVASLSGALASRTLYNPGARAEFAASRPRWNALFLDAATVAMTAGWMSMELRLGRSDRAFLAGMLHDVGKSVALKSLTSLLHNKEIPGPIPYSVVGEILERVHVQIGTQVHEEWALPPYLGTLCAQHHEAVVPDNAETAEIHLVRVASGLRHLRTTPAPVAGIADQLWQSLQVLKIDKFRFRSIDTQMHELAQRNAALTG